MSVSELNLYLYTCLELDKTIRVISALLLLQDRYDRAQKLGENVIARAVFIHV